jgi:two-component system sensor histidine kinase PilS (NtrC family)
MIGADPLAGIPADYFPDRRYLWRVFRASHVYRLALAALLLVAYGLDEQNRLFGKSQPELFLGAALGFMALTLLAIAGSYWRRPRLPVQAHLQMLVDLVALTVMIHASGGLNSSLNSLLITAVAASGILLPLSSALLAAALGFFLLIGSWLVSQWHSVAALASIRRGLEGWPGLWERVGNSTDEWVRLGVLGAALFIAAVLTYALAERARQGEALARRRSFELLEVAELNQGIIRHLQSGVVVVDGEGRVLLLNDTARNVLGWTDSGLGMMLEALSPPLAQRLQLWLNGDGQETRVFRPAEHRPELIPRFTRLSSIQTAKVLILLDDSEEAAERLQQIKLAALGRLSAGIAHEIRNPLGAISHAAQLLQESASASASDRRLAQIIHDHVKRANRIIADVLDLARRDRVKPERLRLAQWLEHFRWEYAPDGDGPLPQWRQTVEPDTLTVTFDPHQLRQVLWNLCSNACQHGFQPGEPPRLELRARLESGRRRPFLEVRDAGPGIPEENLVKLFEPFFTTRARGTGLGLYLARELCEANRAQLQYLPIAEGGSCFRITFAPVSPAPETE